MKLIQCLACEGADCLKPINKCSKAVVCFDFEKNYGNGTISRSKGCLETEQYAQLQCASKLKKSNHQFSMRCCDTDFCNVGRSYTSVSPVETFPIMSFIIGFVVILALCCLGVFAYLVIRRSRRKLQSNCIEGKLAEDLTSCSTSETSGSGLGAPLCTARTVSREISLCGRFYQGRSTEVWRGKWLGHHVAVKVFYTRDEHMFNRELEVYRSINKHTNILEFLAADCTSVDSCTQQWLITNYYELGSMYDFLNMNTLGLSQCLSILLGIINGLDFLHSEDTSPQIAHRDLKSKNIIMKNSWNVCIADFGLAVTHYPKTGQIINGKKSKVGTIRYMPPEILSDTFDGDNFANHKKADMYSLALVIWEALRRCGDDQVPDYNLPFEGVVPRDPSFEDMYNAVCVNKQRPNVDEKVSSDPNLSKISKIMEECWKAEPSMRLTSLRVKKSLNKIKASLIQV